MASHFDAAGDDECLAVAIEICDNAVEQLIAETFSPPAAAATTDTDDLIRTDLDEFLDLARDMQKVNETTPKHHRIKLDRPPPRSLAPVVSNSMC